MTHAQSQILASTLAFLGLGCPASEPPTSADSESTTGGSATSGAPTGTSTTSADTGTETLGATETDTVGATDGATDGDTDTDTEGCVGECPGAVSTDPCPADVAARSTLFGVHRRETDDPSPGCKDSCFWPSAALVTYDARTGAPTEIGESRPDIVPHALALADDGSIIVAGEVRPLDFEPGTEALMRFDEQGQVLWDLDLPGGVILDVAVFGDEVIALASPGVAGFALSNGSPVWGIEVTDTLLRRVAVDWDGNVYVIGTESSDFVRKFDPEHSQVWEVLDAPVDGEQRSLVELSLDQAGGVVTGTQVHVVATDQDVFDVRRLDGDGNEAWSVRFDAGIALPSWDDAVMDLESLPGGGVVVAGRSAESGGVALLAVVDDTGEVLSSKTVDRDERTGEWFEEAVVLGKDVFALGCGEKTWMSTLP